MAEKFHGHGEMTGDTSLEAEKFHGHGEMTGDTSLHPPGLKSSIFSGHVGMDAPENHEDTSLYGEYLT